MFISNATYSFTIGTSSGNHFPFLLKIEEEMVKQENLTIIDYYFSSGILVGYQSWDIRAGNFGDIPIIVRRTTVFNDVDDKYWKFEKKQWFFPNEIQALELNFSWGYGVTYYATIETAAGNEYYVIETAE
ncbi:MAG: hypothetical protein OEY24_06260 [Candidatus Bathyarchaeota archaeon]|nr:hypothetical protein [Candidatus Bathyarchaeota archaeon]